MALAVDALHSTRPIEYPVGPPRGRGHARRPDLPKGAACCACSSSSSARRPSEMASRATCGPRLRNAVTAGPVGGPRGGERLPVRRSWTVDPPGRPSPVSLEASPSRSARSPSARRSRAPTAPSLALAGAGAHEAPGRDRGRRPHILLGAEPIDVDPFPPRSWSTPGATASTGSPTAPTSWPNSPPRSTGCSPSSGPTLVADTWSAVQAQASSRPTSSPLPPTSATRTSPPPGPCWSGPRLCDRPWLGEDAAPAVAHATVALPRPAFDQLVSTRRPAKRRTPTLRALLLGASAHRAQCGHPHEASLASTPRQPAPALSPDLESTILGVVASRFGDPARRKR